MSVVKMGKLRPWAIPRAKMRLGEGTWVCISSHAISHWHLNLKPSTALTMYIF